MRHPDTPNPAPRSVLLAALSGPAQAAVLARAKTRRYAAGTALFLEGDSGDFLFVLDAGRVEISRSAANGRRAVLNHMGAGEILGEIAVLDRGPRSADAIAVEEVTARVLYRSDLLAFLAGDQEATAALLAELCARVRNASDMFALQSQLSAQARLAACLLRIAAKWGAAGGSGETVIATPFSQSDLGAFSGLARENVSRHLKALTEAGIVTHHGGVLTLHDLAQLEEIAGR